VKKVNILEV